MSQKQKITDPRFVHIFKDPRFKSMPKNSKKVTIDQRFKGVLKDSRFSTVPKFDKWGNKIKSQQNDLEDHYIEGEELSQNSQEQNERPDNENSSFDESEDQEEVESIDNSDDYYNELPDGWDEDENVPKIQEATSRLALQNYDWTIISAKDLMVLFSSFIPPGAHIQNISVYQSEFGKQKMNDENERGPAQIFKKGYVYTDKQKKTAAQVAQEINQLIIHGDQQDLDVDPDNLRKYERDRLKYYYAVIKCDSPETADAIYKNTLGQEFELSNIVIDLRFVPEDIEFQDEPTQFCDKIANLPGTKNLLSRAVGHTNVKLTWDEHIPKVNFWKGKTEADLEKIDWSEYLGDVDVPLEEEEVNKLIEENEMQNQNLNIPKSDWRDAFDKKKKNKNREFEMEITFNTGFNEAGNSILEKETIKKPKKSRFAQNQQTDDFFIGFDENQKQENQQKLPFKERQKLMKQEAKQKKIINQQEKQRQIKELELLVDKKNKNNQEYDPEDRRFKAVFDHADYAIDPTDKNFKTEKTGKIFNEQIKRKKIKNQ